MKLARETTLWPKMKSSALKRRVKINQNQHPNFCGLTASRLLVRCDPRRLDKCYEDGQERLEGDD